MADKKAKQELEEAIKSGLQKIKGSKESELCRFIPVETGGYIHHFTFRKMKGEDPKTLTGWIKKHVVNVSKPQTVPPKARAARGSRKRGQLNFTRNDLEKILHMARITGNEEIVRKLTARWDFKGVQRRLIASIKDGRVDLELWNTYVDAVSTMQAPEKEAVPSAS